MNEEVSSTTEGVRGPPTEKSAVADFVPAWDFLNPIRIGKRVIVFILPFSRKILHNFTKEI